MASQEAEQRQRLMAITNNLADSANFQVASTAERYQRLLHAGLPLRFVVQMKLEGASLIVAFTMIDHLSKLANMDVVEQIANAMVNGNTVDLGTTFSPQEENTYELTTKHGRYLKRADNLAPELLTSARGRVELLTELDAISREIEPESPLGSNGKSIFDVLKINIDMSHSPLIVASEIAHWLTTYGAITTAKDGSYIQSEDVFDRALAEYKRRKQQPDEGSRRQTN